MVEWPSAFSASILSPLGAHPLALMAVSEPVLASQEMAKRSPPMPLLSGSTTPSVALAAMAASMADPPRARTCAPACEASVWLVATMPRSEITMERACVRSCACAAIGNISNGRNVRYRMNPKSYQLPSTGGLCSPPLLTGEAGGKPETVHSTRRRGDTEEHAEEGAGQE